MAKGLARQVRRAILAHLKSDADFTAIVPASDIFPQSTPSSPPDRFVKTGAFGSTPLKAPGCLDGALVRATLHCFAKSEFDGSGAKAKEAEDAVDEIIGGLEESLDGAILNIGAVRINIRWLNSLSQIDEAEEDMFHGTVDFRGRVLAE